ncbi:hypothetical protein RugamoR57_36600 [Duganella caerulea]|uniref:hypothetical protein n=1 Tax=Duganella caerulea TaxID=2885762 RepID=UPI0030E9BF7A
MNKLLVTKLKNAVSKSAKYGNSEAGKENLHPNIAGMQQLTMEEYSAVAGGPEVENEPEGD